MRHSFKTLQTFVLVVICVFCAYAQNCVLFACVSGFTAIACLSQCVCVCMYACMHACMHVLLHACMLCGYIHLDYAHARTQAHNTHMYMHAYTGAGRMDAVSHRQSGRDIRAALRRRPCLPLLCLARTGANLSDSPFIRLCFEK